MTQYLDFNGKQVGEGKPAYIIAEIGINHNGSVEIAKKLIDVALESGCDAVKFQKRTPELCVPQDQRDVIRDTPWGQMTYLAYRERIELGLDEYTEIDDYCRKAGIDWFASCWDEPSVDFIEQFDPTCYKIASASLTDDDLLKFTVSKGRNIIASTGMSTLDQIRHAVSILDTSKLILTHCTSSYPCPPEQLNLRMIDSLRDIFDCPIGYSGHETGLQTTLGAVALGAIVVERHITLDRSMWGSDQAASVEPQGFRRLVRDIRVLEQAMGDGIKKVYDSELPLIERLRRV